MPRLFIGSFLASHEAERISSITRARAEQFSSSAAHQGKEFRIRALPKEKLHLTWLFLGEVSSEDLEVLTKKFTATLAQLKTKLSGSDFEISYDHLSLWPSEDKARVAVLRPSVPPPQVAIIDLEIRAALSDFQENAEVYPQFNPHLTLFRFTPAADLRATNLLAILPVLPAVPQDESMADQQPILPVKQTISLDTIRLIASKDGYRTIA